MSSDICQWIETHADFVPEKLAVRFEGREITYRQLLLQIRTTAAVLKASHDIGRGDRIAYLGLILPRCWCFSLPVHGWVPCYCHSTGD